MSEERSTRRAPPSPLVFSPEKVLPPIPLPLSKQPSVNHGSGTNTVSMPFVRRHVTRRLKAAKSECDKELQRVTNNITAFFEERLRENDHERETERDYRDRERDRDSPQLGDVENLRETFTQGRPHSQALSVADDAGSDGGYEAEYEVNRSIVPQPSLSPSSLKRQTTLPWDHALSHTASSSTTSVVALTGSLTSAMDAASPPRKQHSNNNIPPPSWGNSQNMPNRRLSRTIHIPNRTTRSSNSSRSNSRSRSPLPPPTNHSSFSEVYNSGPVQSLNHRHSRILVDDPIDPIMTALYEIIGVATDITDMSMTQLTSQPKVCETLVQRIQNIGKAWDEHPDWHGRNWYVQVLLAVASLSRVVEWWEAEKSFWNFDDNDDEQDEPLTFVMKPPEEPAMTPAPTPTLEALDPLSQLGAHLAVTSDDENKLRLHRPTSHGRRSRDEMTKNLSAAITKAAEEASPVGANRTMESARVLATERLRLQAETAQSQNIVMELSLDGDHFIWVNHAWRSVIGTDSDGLSGTRISRMLAPSDWNVFRDATQHLQDDDSHTVEVSFKLQVEPEDDRDVSCGTLYQQMEGKGMLMIDREDGQASHTMWVVKPIASPRYELPSPSIALEGGEVGDDPALGEAGDATFADRSGMEPATPFPFSLPISTELLLCRICEGQIPQWYFEKHSETCVEVHRLEAEIAECNESISELRNTIRDLCKAVDKSAGIAPEYRGMPLMSPSSSPGSSSPLHLFRVNKLQRMGVKRMQRRLLEQLEDILSVASEVEVPSLKEEEAMEPIERQRLLSPGSERKMSQIRNWGKPNTQDPALGQLVDDAERVMRQKIDNLVRMQNTIRYSEKIWHEWQERVEAELDEESDSDSDSGEETGEERQPRGVGDADDDRASFNSEYALARGQSSEPTPMASSPSLDASATAFTASPRTSAGSSLPAPFLFSPPPPLWPSSPAPPPWQVISKLPARSSTPSSVSSPLALAAPIVASSSANEMPPPMSLNDGPSTGALTIRTQRSAGNLLEPPTSPMLSPRDAVSTRRGHRRHSTAANILLGPGSGPGSGSGTPLSPRLPSAAPLSRATPTSIKDFEIIKPISKGAFGSVFLAKKRATGDYFAIKVLKKADMIAKNQITNVKAERMILMKQAESPFVAKLYFTFQSKENLYLVMEYLNGGDCAALIKTLGCLPEEWTKNYIAEVVLGLEYLHQQGVVHRDLKPDNLLIDQHGHLKLTDFGLSRIGLLGRQTRESQVGLRPRPSHGSRSRPPSMDSAYLSSPLMSAADVLSGDDVSESSGSESLAGFPRPRAGTKSNESPLQSFATELTNDLRSHSGLGTPPGEGKFVGTPDYLAPETILGLRGDDATVDWWALGVIAYEFLYGIPPFHAETPEKVFENILSGHIDWHEDWDEFSDEARDFMQQLMTLNTNERLGANGADEVKAHPWFDGMNWDTVTNIEAAFIPQVTDPESTDYFDPRGAIPQLFHEEDHIAHAGASQSAEDSPRLAASMPPPLHVPTDRDGASSGKDDFGSFSFKNLPVLKQANDDVIRKLKTDQMVPLTHTLSDPAPYHSRKRSLSQRIKKQPPSVNTSSLDSRPNQTGPPSPATSTSSIASSPSRTSLPSLNPGGASSHARKPSEYGAVERFKLNHLDGIERRNSLPLPSRLRTASVSSAGEGSGSEQNWASHGSQFDASTTPPSSVHSIDLRKGPDPSDRAVTCLLAEDNPITAKIIETLLIRLGCRCIVVADGSEAISTAMGDIKFDCILMDLHMPVLDGEGAARYIKSTNSKNTSTPIIAISAYSGGGENSEAGNVFAASLSKPLQKADILSVMRSLGFKTSSVPGGPGATKVTATRVVS